jgi:ribosomal protein L30/L7E
MRRMVAGGLTVSLMLSWMGTAIALPPPEDQPEERLRSDVITGARSPLDGKPLTATEYVELQAELQTPPPSRPQVAPQVEKTIKLLRLRRFLRTVFPFRAPRTKDCLKTI